MEKSTKKSWDYCDPVNYSAQVASAKQHLIREAPGKSNGNAPCEKLLRVLSDEVISCRKCPRLVEYREMVAREKRRAYRDCEYWGKPVPGFGSSQAQLLIVGLAPGAHGSNRTGRMFTGDRSGEFLYGALFQAGFANQPTAVHRDDDLRLINAYISATARCAPPDNKPLPQELLNCRNYLEREIDILKPRAVLALGRIAWESCLRIFSNMGFAPSPVDSTEGSEGVASSARKAILFAHAAEIQLQSTKGEKKMPGPRLFGVYHPSQQNTQTGLLTAEMYARVFERIRFFLRS